MPTLIQNLSTVFGQPNATDVRINGNIIVEIGQRLAPNEADTLIDGSACIAYPGFVNTHHHLAQSVLKGIPAGLNQPLGQWLASVPYQYWPRIEPELMYHAAKLGLYELLRSGATTCADHHYLYHKDSTTELEDAVWQAAQDLGVRFTLCRGGANVIGSHKGLQDAGIEPESIHQTLERLEDTLSTYHQSTPDAMRKLVVAPTSLVHSSTPEQLRILADFARHNKLKLHSHLLEVSFDQQQARERYKMDAIDYAEHCHWLGDDVWFAHLVKSDEKTIQRLAQTKTGIAHCPTSNCRLGSGVAPVIAMQKAGVPISLGVDGSASSESGSMLQEVNLTWLIHRAMNGADATTIEQTVQWASKGGAQILGYENLGELKVGDLADIVLYDTFGVRYCGSHSAELNPVLLGEPASVKYSFVDGKCVVDNGTIENLDEMDLIHNVRAQLLKIAP